MQRTGQFRCSLHSDSRVSRFSHDGLIDDGICRRTEAGSNAGHHHQHHRNLLEVQRYSCRSPLSSHRCEHGSFLDQVQQNHRPSWKRGFQAIGSKDSQRCGLGGFLLAKVAHVLTWGIYLPTHAFWCCSHSLPALCTPTNGRLHVCTRPYMTSRTYCAHEGMTRMCGGAYVPR